MGWAHVIAGLVGLATLTGGVLLFRYAHIRRHRLDTDVLFAYRAFAVVLVGGTVALLISVLINR